MVEFQLSLTRPKPDIITFRALKETAKLILSLRDYLSDFNAFVLFS
jgi:hypothetical protein